MEYASDEHIASMRKTVDSSGTSLLLLWQRASKLLQAFRCVSTRNLFLHTLRPKFLRPNTLSAQGFFGKKHLMSPSGANCLKMSEVCLTLKAFSEKLTVPRDLQQAGLDREAFAKAFAVSLADLRDIVKSAYAQCVLALRTSGGAGMLGSLSTNHPIEHSEVCVADPTVSGFQQTFVSAIIMLPDIEIFLVKQILSQHVRKQEEIMHMITVALETMKRLLYHLKGLIPQRQELEGYCRSLFKCKGHDRLISHIFKDDKPEVRTISLPVLIHSSA